MKRIESLDLGIELELELYIEKLESCQCRDRNPRYRNAHSELVTLARSGRRGPRHALSARCLEVGGGRLLSIFQSLILRSQMPMTICGRLTCSIVPIQTTRTC